MSGKSILKGFTELALAIRREPNYFIRELIFRTRKEKKKGLREVAKKVGISHNELFYLEKGKPEITVDQAVKISHALGINEQEVDSALHRDLDQKIIVSREKLK